MGTCCSAESEPVEVENVFTEAVSDSSYAPVTSKEKTKGKKHHGSTSPSGGSTKRSIERTEAEVGDQNSARSLSTKDDTKDDKSSPSSVDMNPDEASSAAKTYGAPAEVQEEVAHEIREFSDVQEEDAARGQKVASPAKVSSPKKKPVLVGEDAANGAYLMYSGENGGSLSIVWRKEVQDGALVFAKPQEGIRIPPFKYKGTAEVARNLARNKKPLLSSVLQFIRSMRTFQCEITLLDYRTAEINAPLCDFFLVTHGKDEQVSVIRAFDSFKLPDVDLVAAVASGTRSETNMTSFKGATNLVNFMAKVKINPENVETIQF